MGIITEDSSGEKLSKKVRFLNCFRRLFKQPLLEKWLVKRTFGKSPNSFFAKMVPNNYQYSPKSMRQVDIGGGLSFTVDIHDYIGHYIFFGFRSIEMDKLFSLINRSDTVIDIGANYGFVTLKIASIVGNDGKVYSFEPDPQNFQSCLINVSQNRFKNITLENKGLGPLTSQMFLEVNTPSNRGGNRINNNPSKEHVLVEIITLDDFVEGKQIDNINLIKIDVEGFEHQILQGAINTIKKFKPICFIEIDEQNLQLQGDSARDIIILLSNLGYTHFERADNGESVSVDSDFNNMHYDIVCK